VAVEFVKMELVVVEALVEVELVMLLMEEMELQILVVAVELVVLRQVMEEVELLF